MVLPLLWVATMGLVGGYDPRFIGVGSEEFRRVLNGALALTATVAIASYAVKFQTARGYVVIALPCATVFDLVIRHRLRKRLHMLRSKGACMRKVVAVGHAPAVADLVGELRRGTYHGLSVVGACLAAAACCTRSPASRRTAGWTASPTRWASSARTRSRCWPARR